MTAKPNLPPPAHLPAAEDALKMRLSQSLLLPVLRASNQALLVTQVDMCLEAGLNVLELTTTSPGWEDVLVRLKADSQCAHVMVGVGTTVSSELAKSARDCGADFLVTPYRVPELSQVQGLPPVVLGAFSPSELAEAHRSGAQVIKLFPASVVGPAYLQSVLQVLPGAVIVPTGGITSDSATSWVKAGAHAVGMGGHLFDNGSAGIRTLQRTLIQTRADMATTN